MVDVVINDNSLVVAADNDNERGIIDYGNDEDDDQHDNDVHNDDDQVTSTDDYNDTVR